MTDLPLLTASQMASFTARGFLRFDGVVPEDINSQFLAEMGDIASPQPDSTLRQAYGRLLAEAGVPEVAAGTPLARAYPQGSAVNRMLEMPLVAGALRSHGHSLALAWAIMLACCVVLAAMAWRFAPLSTPHQA